MDGMLHLALRESDAQRRPKHFRKKLFISAPESQSTSRPARDASIINAAIIHNMAYAHHAIA